MLREGVNDQMALTPGTGVLYQMDSRFDMPHRLCTRCTGGNSVPLTETKSFASVFEFFQSHVIVILSHD
jgi:hypothetical protein